MSSTRNRIYLRGLRGAQRKYRLTEKELVRSLDISLRTLQRLLKGQTISQNLAENILQKATKKKWEKSVFLEKPEHQLQLTLDPKRKRITRFDFRDFIVIEAEVFQQALDGCTFTFSFAKRLQKFLRQIPVLPDEYKIVQIANSGDHKCVEEWKAKSSILEDGDGLLDLRIILRERLNCWSFAPQEYREKLAKNIANSGEAKILRLDLPKSAIEALTSEEQNLLIAFGAATNELNFLLRLTIVAAHQKRKGRIYDAYALSQHFTSLKLYAGKISECWKLARRRFFNTKLSQKYVPLLPPHSKNALSEIKQYFNNSKNIVDLIRNEVAFHFSKSDLFPALETIPNDKPCTSFLAGPRFYNELFDFCEIAMANHLLRQINKNRYQAIRTIQKDIGLVGVQMVAFLAGAAFAVLCQAGGKSQGKGRQISQSVPLERKKDTYSIPIFIHPHDYTTEYYNLSKMLK